MSIPLWAETPFSFQRWGRTTVCNHSVQYNRAFFAASLIDYTFWYLDQGKGVLINHSTEEEFLLESGCCLMMHPGDELEIECTKPILGAYIHWDIPSLVDKPRVNIPLSYCANAIPNLERSMHRVVELLNESMRLPSVGAKRQLIFAAEQLFKSCILQIAVSSRRPRVDSPQDIVVNRLLAALQGEPCRFRSVKEMAHFTGYSMSHLRTLCYEKTGQSPAALLIQYRIEHAKRYLLHTELMVGVIAESLGYENIYYFSTQFRKVTGLTPTEFRAARLSV